MNQHSLGNSPYIEQSVPVRQKDMPAASRPFNPGRLWHKSRVAIPPHVFLMNNKGKLVTDEMKRGESEEILKEKTNVFMETYRKILPKEYRRGLIPMKKRKFLIDKEKQLNVEQMHRADAHRQKCLVHDPRPLMGKVLLFPIVV